MQNILKISKINVSGDMNILKHSLNNTYTIQYYLV